jgi:hypothetical protein
MVKRSTFMCGIIVALIIALLVGVGATYGKYRLEWHAVRTRTADLKEKEAELKKEKAANDKLFRETVATFNKAIRVEAEQRAHLQKAQELRAYHQAEWRKTAAEWRKAAKTTLEATRALAEAERQGQAYEDRLTAVEEREKRLQERERRCGQKLRAP